MFEFELQVQEIACHLLLTSQYRRLLSEGAKPLAKIEKRAEIHRCELRMMGMGLAPLVHSLPHERRPEYVNDLLKEFDDGPTEAKETRE